MKKHTKCTKIIGNVFFGILILAIILLIFSLGKSKMTGQAPTIVGCHMYIVVSGSMNPTFDTGSLVIVKPIDPEKVKKEDVITFKGAGDSEGLTSHRVVTINNTLDGITFTTKGDANEVIDPVPIKAEKLVGKIMLAIPYMGYLMNFIKTKQGVVIFIVIPIALLSLCELLKLFAGSKKEKKELIKEDQ